MQTFFYGAMADRMGKFRELFSNDLYNKQLAILTQDVAIGLRYKDLQPSK